MLNKNYTAKEAGIIATVCTALAVTFGVAIANYTASDHETSTGLKNIKQTSERIQYKSFNK